MTIRPLTTFTIPAGCAASCSVCLSVITGGSLAVADDCGRITCRACDRRR